MVLALHLVALRHRAVDCPVVKAAAAEQALRPVAYRRTAALRDGPHVFDVRVLAPLPDVPGHVEEAELVRRLQADVLGVVAALAVVPRDQVDVVTAAEPIPVPPVRAA